MIPFDNDLPHDPDGDGGAMTMNDEIGEVAVTPIQNNYLRDTGWKI